MEREDRPARRRRDPELVRAEQRFMWSNTVLAKPALVLAAVVLAVYLLVRVL
jgi:hypothetical protein